MLISAEEGFWNIFFMSIIGFAGSVAADRTDDAAVVKAVGGALQMDLKIWMVSIDLTCSYRH